MSPTAAAAAAAAHPSPPAPALQAPPHFLVACLLRGWLAEEPRWTLLAAGLRLVSRGWREAVAETLPLLVPSDGAARPAAAAAVVAAAAAKLPALRLLQLSGVTQLEAVCGGCTALRALRLLHCHCLPGQAEPACPSPAGMRPLSLLRQLRSLEIVAPGWRMPAAALDPLQELRALQRLSVRVTWVALAGEHRCECPPGLLPRVRGDACHAGTTTPRAGATTGSLARLRRCLRPRAKAPPACRTAGLAALTGLTSLEVAADAVCTLWWNSLTDSLPQLPRLRHLGLEISGFLPTGGMPELVGRPPAEPAPLALPPRLASLALCLRMREHDLPRLLGPALAAQAGGGRPAMLRRLHLEVCERAEPLPAPLPLDALAGLEALTLRHCLLVRPGEARCRAGACTCAGGASSRHAGLLLADGQCWRPTCTRSCLRRPIWPAWRRR